MIAFRANRPLTVGRRSTIRFGIAGAAALLLPAHTPYEQWVVYRRRVLLIGSSRDDPEGYALARQVAATLAEGLPESRARASRAPTAGRLANLIATDQLGYAVLPWSQGTALARGRPPFADLGGVALAGLFGLKGHVLVSRPDVPASHAYLIARTLNRANGSATGDRFDLAKAEGAVALHPGVQEYVAGREMPEPAHAALGEAEPGHHHGD